MCYGKNNNVKTEFVKKVANLQKLMSVEKILKMMHNLKSLKHFMLNEHQASLLAFYNPNKLKKQKMNFRSACQGLKEKSSRDKIDTILMENINFN